VDVLYAGSFLDLMEQQIDPAFHKATGYTVSGFSAGSSALATEIAGGTQVGDVFISASPAVNDSLAGVANGNWVTSYDEFGTSPLVLGYNPNSRFAMAVDALTGVALSYDLPELATLASGSSNIFPETALVGELQAGQLDAGFFYGVEAAAAHIKTVGLVGTDLVAQYTVSILNRAPHETAAKAFVKFLLSKQGQKILRANGIASISPAKVIRASRTSTTTTMATTTTAAP
jgi:molybdate/tungstate transport system substrate-binding protein